MSSTDLATDFACDIAIWLRVHASQEWTSHNEALMGLAQHLVRVVEHNGYSAPDDSPTTNTPTKALGIFEGSVADCGVSPAFSVETRADRPL